MVLYDVAVLPFNKIEMLTNKLIKMGENYLDLYKFFLLINIELLFPTPEMQCSLLVHLLMGLFIILMFYQLFFHF